MSRIVRDSAELDGGVRRRASTACSIAWRRRTPPTLKRFLAAVDDFMYDHGGRGPNEWDVYQRSYETNPTMLLQAIERTRHAADDADPDARRSNAAPPSVSD